MQGYAYTGTIKLAGDFPPSVNTSDDVSKLKPYESPACYGVDCKRDGLLKSGTIPSGTARIATIKNIGTPAVGYNWYFNRLWRIDNKDLIFGAKYYDDVYHIQGPGKVTAEDNIMAFMPCLSNKMWLATPSGSQFIDGIERDAGNFALRQLVQELNISVGKSTSALTLDEQPYVVNTKGIFSYDGQSVKEWTRPVRYSLGSFANEVVLTADYQQKFIIGANSFVLDPTNGKLFDYGTAGFLFTSRTVVGDNYRPFGIGDIGFSIQYNPADLADGTIEWQSKTEDGAWFDEEDIELKAGNGMDTLVQVRPNNPTTNAHKFAIRITVLPQNIFIREISMNVVGLAQGSFSV
jgi:hypothetical protein